MKQTVLRLRVILFIATILFLTAVFVGSGGSFTELLQALIIEVMGIMFFWVFIEIYIDNLLENKVLESRTKLFNRKVSNYLENAISALENGQDFPEPPEDLKKEGHLIAEFGEYLFHKRRNR